MVFGRLSVPNRLVGTPNGCTTAGDVIMVLDRRFGTASSEPPSDEKFMLSVFNS